MQEELDFYIEATEESMQNSIAHLQRELINVRTGKASASTFDSLFVDYYGSPTPLRQVSNVSTPDARTITVKPWEKNMLQVIERAIIAANMGFNPQNDGEIIRINIPALTEDRRKEYVKKAKALAEDAKVSIRNARRDAMTEIKKAVKDGFPEDAGKKYEADVEEMTKKYSDQADKLFHAKEKDIMTI